MDRQEHARTVLTEQLDYLTIVALDEKDWDELYCGVPGWGIPYQVGYEIDDENAKFIMPVCWDVMAQYPGEDPMFEAWIYWVMLMASAYVGTRGGEGARLAACLREMETSVEGAADNG